jgi:hypothetical protein
VGAGRRAVIRLQSIVINQLVPLERNDEGYCNWSVKWRKLRSFIDCINAFICPGASGVLGTAVFDAFAKNAPRDSDDHTVIGLANSRPGGNRNLHKLDLLDTDAVSTFFRDAKPNCKPPSIYLTGVPFVASPRVISPSTYPSNEKSQAAALPHSSTPWWFLRLTLFRTRRGDTLCGGAQA